MKILMNINNIYKFCFFSFILFIVHNAFAVETGMATALKIAITSTINNPNNNPPVELQGYFVSLSRQ